MSKENDEKVVKEIIEYANKEITKSKKKFATILIAVLVGIAVVIAGIFFVAVYETPVSYSKDLIKVKVPEDKGLDITINLSNYKNAKAVLVKIDDDTYDLYVCVAQTLATRIIGDNDEANNLLRVGNGIIVDFQSESIHGYMPENSSAENIANVYYIDKMTNEIMAMDDAELDAYENKVLVWSR